MCNKLMQMKNIRYLMAIILLCTCANVCQAAQQYRPINAGAGRVVLSASASLGGAASASGSKKGGTQFPVIPAGAKVSQSRPSGANQQNQSSGKAGNNNPNTVATVPQKQAGSTEVAISQTSNAAPQK
jgi:hypothetical protein